MKRMYEGFKVEDEIDVFLRGNREKEIVGNPCIITKVTKAFVDAVDCNNKERIFRFVDFDIKVRGKKR